MNIAFFLLPKEKVDYIESTANMRQALDKMERHYYTALPIIDSDGRYESTLTEGDLLWKLKDTPGLDFDNMDSISVDEIEKHVLNISVSINAEMEDMLALASEQNFVPVTDNDGLFLGIIRRKDIIDYYMNSITD